MNENDRAADLTKSAFVSFSAFTTGGAALIDQLAGEAGTESVSGLGERALYQPAQGLVFILKSGTVVSVQVFKFRPARQPRRRARCSRRPQPRLMTTEYGLSVTTAGERPRNEDVAFRLLNVASTNQSDVSSERQIVD